MAAPLRLDELVDVFQTPAEIVHSLQGNNKFHGRLLLIALNLLLRHVTMQS